MASNLKAIVLPDEALFDSPGLVVNRTTNQSSNIELPLEITAIEDRSARNAIGLVYHSVMSKVDKVQRETDAHFQSANAFVQKQVEMVLLTRRIEDMPFASSLVDDIKKAVCTNQVPDRKELQRKLGQYIKGTLGHQPSAILKRGRKFINKKINDYRTIINRRALMYNPSGPIPLVPVKTLAGEVFKVCLRNIEYDEAETIAYLDLARKIRSVCTEAKQSGKSIWHCLKEQDAEELEDDQ